MQYRPNGEAFSHVVFIEDEHRLQGFSIHALYDPSTFCLGLFVSIDRALLVFIGFISPPYSCVCV